jgi:hypothetical protein
MDIYEHVYMIESAATGTVLQEIKLNRVYTEQQIQVPTTAELKPYICWIFYCTNETGHPNSCLLYIYIYCIYIMNECRNLYKSIYKHT